jgi:hypothetical protein
MSPLKGLGTSLLALTGWLLLISPSSIGTAQVKKSSFLPRLKDDSRTWTRYTPATDKFVVAMPKNPTVQQEVRVINGQPLLLSYYGARLGKSVYAVVTITGLNDANWNLAHMLMLDFYVRVNADLFLPQGVQGLSTIKATYQRDISLDSYAGRQFSLESFDKTGEWRLYKTDTRFYAVTVCTNSDYLSSSKRFLASFTFSSSAINPTTAVVNAAEGERVSNSTNRWLIILQTFSSHERVRAIQKMNLLRSRGYDVQVINTSSYRNLRPGLLSVAMGPYSRRAADERLAGVRLVAPQSYIKPGW